MRLSFFLLSLFLSSDLLGLFLKSGCGFLPFFLIAFATAFCTASRTRFPSSTVRRSSSLRRSATWAGVSARNWSGVQPNRAAAHAQSASVALGPRSGPGSPGLKYSYSTAASGIKNRSRGPAPR